MEKPKLIIQKTNYWLFEKTSENSKYYFVRIQTDGISTHSWSMGYENSFGLVSCIGGPLNEERVKDLEERFQLTNK